MNTGEKVKVTELERVFKKEAFKKDVLRKIEEGVYECHGSLTLYDLVILSGCGYYTVVVTDKSIYVLSNFGVKLENEKVERIFFIASDKVLSISLFSTTMTLSKVSI